MRSFSKSPARHWFWKNISNQLNEHHPLFAWCSLVSIVVCDFYVWLVASGTITDPKIF